MDDPRPSTRERIVSDCRLARRMKIVVDSGNGIPGASAPGILRALGCEVIELYSRGRRRLPEPPPRSEQAGEPGRPDQGRACHRGRAGPGLRRRRRPARRGHARRPDHLPRPPADAVRARRARAQSGRDDHLRRQVLAAPGADDPRGRRRAADVEDRPLADQGQAEGDRRAAGRRDERPHLLQRALVRLRRRHLHRGAPARDPVAQRRSRARCSTHCPPASARPS